MRQAALAAVTKITVRGYKSIADKQSIEIRPLTILAGANSSGKSSIMQPLLLLKQTLELPYDPQGALELKGPNVLFTSADQLLPKGSKNFSIELHIGSFKLGFHFVKRLEGGFDIEQMDYEDSPQDKGTLRNDMSSDAVKKFLSHRFRGLFNNLPPFSPFDKDQLQGVIRRSRCFLYADLLSAREHESVLQAFPLSASVAKEGLRHLIHLPGLRGNPERTYPVTGVGPTFPGTFEKYTASVIARWQANDEKEKLEKLGKDLETLGLTWKVMAKPISDTQVELQVGRLPRAIRGGAHDLVNIADVGFGVSQTLPVLVALNVAKSGQLVYIEQPEIHLHPRAQAAMAELLANAAGREVRVVAETHSSILIRKVQTLVAQGKLKPEIVKLHWFERKDGVTTIRSADLDERGAFGDWPEDFTEVELDTESNYLDAVAARSPSRTHAL